MSFDLSVGNSGGLTPPTSVTSPAVLSPAVLSPAVLSPAPLEGEGVISAPTEASLNPCLLNPGILALSEKIPSLLTVKDEDPSCQQIDPYGKTHHVIVSGLPATLLPRGVKIDIGKGYSKIVSYENFLEILEEMVGRTEKTAKQSSFILPSGAFWIEQAGERLEIACFYPESKRRLLFTDSRWTTNQEIIAPNIIIHHRLKKKSKEGEWALTASFYYCTNKGEEEFPRSKPLLTERHISILPFSNVYDDGRLCMGENQGITNYKNNNLTPLNWYFDLLWRSSFNNDLGARAVRRYDSVSSWYSRLADRAKKNLPFPYEELHKFPST